ncbi:hypothetical protein BJ138DRAFT_1125279 [Hygrophoropsis aurantiaca]|uniref:Uncharacterized protein n=1 Tax=Hygrophoropsis aurantiaca TaxID=72124 RepID=A0ACB8AFW3_9AGAM|nr:hypothetical protein BJ138DRAFT_1125279 [Hygrophoropsis aurantiaca]
MPPPSSTPNAPEDDTNAYELLGVSDSATEAEIRTAYRTRSLKVHPDRNRNDPLAAQKFHNLTLASALLLDPLRRLALDAQLRAVRARAERFKGLNSRRRKMVEELEEREREAREGGVSTSGSAKDGWSVKRARKETEAENERIIQAGRRMREERAERAMREAQTVPTPADADTNTDVDADPPPAPTPLDTTVRLRYACAAHPNLTTPAALAAHLGRFGAVDVEACVLSVRAGKRKGGSGKEEQDQGSGGEMVTALVPFAQLAAAYAAVTTGVPGMEVSWAVPAGASASTGGDAATEDAGSTGTNKRGKTKKRDKGTYEPPILGWLRRKGELGGVGAGGVGVGADPSVTGGANVNGTGAGAGQNHDRQEEGTKNTFSSFPASTSFPLAPQPPGTTTGSSTTIPMDFESLMLLRMREAERARLEREILEAEAGEG